MEIKNLFEQLNTNPPDDSYHAKNLIGDRKLIIYGAGGDFNQFRMNVLERCGLTISVIIDRKFKPGSFYGIGPCNPDDYKPTQDDLDNAIALICLGEPKAFREANNYLLVKGFKNIIKSHDIYEHYYIAEDEVIDATYYQKGRDKIEAVYDLLGDQLSRDIYLAFLRSFMFKKFEAVPFNEDQIQYFPNDIPFCINTKRWINCGAWQGDTLKAARNYYLKTEDEKLPQAIYCFEPDFENFIKLVEYINSQQDFKRKTIAYPFGLWRENKVLNFRSGISKACRLLEHGDSQMQCIALDRMGIDFKPTYINMDIEGAELEALKGSIFHLKKYTPDLGICVYHKPSDIWMIPWYIKTHVDSAYKFYLRNHTGFVVETVLYATTSPVGQDLLVDHA